MFLLGFTKHTLASADEFGVVGKEQLEQTKSILVHRSQVGTTLNGGQDRPENSTQQKYQ